MRSEIFETTKSSIQLFSNAIAILLNSFLIFLIYTKSPVKMGNYRHLMCYFCVISITFAVTDSVVRPNIYSRGSAFFMIVDLRRSILSKESARILICVLCGCCGSTIFGIAVHFVYRFFALERQGRLRYFKFPFLIIWFIIPLLAGTNWVFLCYYLFAMCPQSSDYLQPITLEVFNVSTSNISYSAAIFWPTGNVSWSEFNWIHGIGAIDLLMMMQISFLIIISMGIKSGLKIRELLKQGVSKYSRDLQVQLYKALVVQTVIPVLFLFIPLGILFIGPFFLIDVEFISTPVTIFYAIYPALDPLPILFYIDIYRNACREIFCSNCKPNRVEVFTVGNDGERNSTDHSI